MFGLFGRKGPSGFSYSSTAEDVTHGIDGTGLTAIVTALISKTGQLYAYYCSSCGCFVESPICGADWSYEGASAGIGAETARVLALRGVHVILGVRNTSTGEKVKETIIKDASSSKIDVMELDLGSKASIRKFASEFNSLSLPLNILINNAGVMGTPFTLSQDGIELQFATNHIGHFLLTNLLLENMKNAAHKSNIEGRIVNVSSDAHALSYRGGIRFDNINDKSGYNTIFAYGQSKLANILHANGLSRRLREEEVAITANSLHPGAIVTNILRHHSFLNGIVTNLGKFILKNVQQGAATTCYVALHPQVRGVSGKFFINSNKATPSSQARDVDLAKKLWDFSLSLVHDS